MSRKKAVPVLIIYLIFAVSFHIAFSQTISYQEEGCTIGVAAGKATQDGRPMIWKTRDTSAKNNEVYYNTSSSNKFKFIAVVTANGSQGSSAWMGVNEKGFAILNSASSDLSGGSSGPGNGTTMRLALGNCATLTDFEHWLDSTNVTGRQTQANFAVLDSTGAAAIFETAGNQYWKFDANDSTVAPDGYVLRTNFAFNGGAKYGLNDGIYSIERYRRTTKLVGDFFAGDSLNYKSILRTQMRDFSKSNGEPVPVPYPRKWLSYRPYGYIYCFKSICRSTSAAAAVIQGVLPGKPAKFSTMWTILGQPASGIAVPYWCIAPAPSLADGYPTAPLCDIAKKIKGLLFDYADNTNYIDSYKLLDGNGGGLWTKTFPAEDSIFAWTENRLNQWRSGLISNPDMIDFETELAQYAYSTLQSAYFGMITAVAENRFDPQPVGFQLYQNYPNPFNKVTTFRFYLPVESEVLLKIYNLLGEEVQTLADRSFAAGDHQLQWGARDLASGIYFYRIYAQPVNGGSSEKYVVSNELQLIK